MFSVVVMAAVCVNVLKVVIRFVFKKKRLEKY